MNNKKACDGMTEWMNEQVSHWVGGIDRTKSNEWDQKNETNKTKL